MVRDAGGAEVRLSMSVCMYDPFEGRIEGLAVSLAGSVF
jgi:hypothetical protein